MGTAMAQAISLLTMPVLTRAYTPSSFAALNVFNQAVALLSIAITLRFEHAIPLPKRHVDALALSMSVVTLAVGGTLLWTAATWLCAEQLQAWRPSEPLAQWLLVPIAAAAASLAMVSQYLVQRRQAYSRVGMSEVISKIAYFAVAIAGIWLFPAPFGLLLAVLMATSLKAFVLFLSQGGSSRLGRLFHSWPVWMRLATRNVGRYRGLSASMVSSHLMLTLTGLLPALFVSSAYGADALGQMSLVQSTTYLPSALMGAAVGQVYFQRAAGRHAEGQGFFDLWVATVKKLLLFGIPFYGCLAAVSWWIYPAVFGSNWKLAGDFATIMCLASFLSFLSTPLDRSCIVVGAWRYIPLWHLSRLLTTIAVIAAAWEWDWSARQFILGLTLQMSLIYLVDFYAEMRFSRLLPFRTMDTP